MLVHNETEYLLYPGLGNKGFKSQVGWVDKAKMNPEITNKATATETVWKLTNTPPSHHCEIAVDLCCMKEANASLFACRQRQLQIIARAMWRHFIARVKAALI